MTREPPRPCRRSGGCEAVKPCSSIGASYDFRARITLHDGSQLYAKD
jgi:hypothetical protein